jgi:hypothetical protein
MKVSTVIPALAIPALIFVLASGAAHAAPAVGEWGSAFPKGTTAFQVSAEYIHPIRFAEDKFYGGSASGHYYFGDEVSIGVELQGYAVDQVSDDTVLGGAALVLRWHFLADDDFSLFVDGVGGVGLAEAEVPEGGTHFNYMPKIGGGATLRLRDDVHLIGGARFFHLSNGNLHGRDENPSQDGVQYFVGVMWTF